MNLRKRVKKGKTPDVEEPSEKEKKMKKREAAGETRKEKLTLPVIS